MSANFVSALFRRSSVSGSCVLLIHLPIDDLQLREHAERYGAGALLGARMLGLVFPSG